MERLVYCRLCGQQISSKARKCPYCGAKAKKSHVVLKILFGFMGFVILSAVINNMLNPTKKQSTAATSRANDSVSSVTSKEDVIKEKSNASTANNPTRKPTTKPAAKSTPTAAPLPGIGEPVEKNGVQVTLSDVIEKSRGTYYNPGEGNVYILCEVVIENNTSNEINISSIMSFDCYYDGFAALFSLEGLTEKGSANQLDGSIAAGKKMKGVVAYEIPKDWKDLELHFKPDVWSSRSFVFQVKHDDL